MDPISGLEFFPVNSLKDVITFSSMITAMDKSGQWVKALQVFEAMPRAKLQPNIISMSFSEAVCIVSSWFQICFYFHPYLGKIPTLTNIVQMG